jgi:hypothetical protein
LTTGFNNQIGHFRRNFDRGKPFKAQFRQGKAISGAILVGRKPFQAQYWQGINISGAILAGENHFRRNCDREKMRNVVLLLNSKNSKEKHKS